MSSCLPLVPYYSESAQYWYQVKKVGVIPAHSIKSCIRQAVRQVVFTDVLIVGQLDVDCQRFAPIGLHITDPTSDWLHWIGMIDLPGVQLQNESDNSSYRCDFSIYRKEDVWLLLKIRGASRKFKNHPQHLLRPKSVNFRQHCRNLFDETVPLSTYFGILLLDVRRSAVNTAKQSNPIQSRQAASLS